jgi:serine/threonine-protein kinase RsbW
MRLTAVAATASIVRERVRRWLGPLGWPANALDDVVLAVHEAVMNVVDHAYVTMEVGDVGVTGVVLTERGGARAKVVVRDRGRWRTASREPGYRGRGLLVMRGCMHEVDIRTGDDGTEVTMISTAVPVTVRGGTRGPALLAAPRHEVSCRAESTESTERAPSSRAARRRRRRPRGECRGGPDTGLRRRLRRARRAAGTR